ncbi:minor tail protein [Streptomyces phage Kromp]|uniref:Minor tail protein n=1 Tax=Streptomyces phage Kromp TaxID=2315619 RepID=A0A386KA17_9CAUD|nr:minor tail protein [Streptomyces phage Kromp]
MARYTFGGGVADYVVRPSDGLWGVAQGAELTFWSARDGGTQYTDLLDSGGAAATSILADEYGGLPTFSGPDNVVGMWAEAAGGQRVWIEAHSTSAGGGGGGGYTSISRIVASSTAPADVRAAATYVCDGVADQVEIQQALDDARDAGGGEIQLTVGDYNLTAPLSVEGTDDVDVEIGIIVRGQGARATRLVAGAGITAAIHLTKVVRVLFESFGITVAGATDGITSSTTNGASSGHRSFWNSSFKNMQVTGTWDGGHTGWAINMGSPFRSVFENIEIGGVGNGVRMYSEHAEFNPGDLTFERCFVELSGNNGTAYKVESTTTDGVMNQMEFEMCEAIANGTGCTGIEIGGGVGPVHHTHWRGINLEQFDKLINVVRGGGNTFRCNYVELRGAAGLTAFTFGANSYNNSILSCGLLFAGVNTVLFADGNTSLPSQPNSVERTRIYADGTAVITGTANPSGTTIRKGIVGSGTGTISVLNPPGIDAPSQVISLTDGATIATDASRGRHFKVTIAGNRTLSVPTNPVDGQRVIWEVVASGGARTLSLAGGAGGFVFGSDITALSATVSGKTDYIGAVYSATANAWRVIAYTKGY